MRETQYSSYLFTRPSHPEQRCHRLDREVQLGSPGDFGELPHDPSALLVDVHVPLENRVDAFEGRLVVAEASLVGEESLLFGAGNVMPQRTEAPPRHIGDLPEDLRPEPKHAQHGNGAQDGDDGHEVGGVEVSPLTTPCWWRRARGPEHSN